MKLSVVGATGNVGKAVSEVLSRRIRGELVLVGRDPAITRINSDTIRSIHSIFPSKRPLKEEGMHMDREDADHVFIGGKKPPACNGVTAHVKGTTDFSEIRGSDIVILAAGVPRKEGMGRRDLLRTNWEIMRGLFTQVKANNGKEPVIITVTNPSDAMTYGVAKLADCRPGKVIGLGGELDGARYRKFISEALGLPASKISEAPVVGEHGRGMVFVPELTLITYNSTHSETLFDILHGGEYDGYALKILNERIFERTRQRGAEINSHLGSTAFLAPAEAVAKMVELIAKGGDEVAYVSMPLMKDGVSMGMPVRLSRDGAEIARDVLGSMGDETHSGISEGKHAMRETIAKMGV